MKIRFINLLFIVFLFSGLMGIEAEIQTEVFKPELIYIGTPIVVNVQIISDAEYDIYHPVQDTVGVFSITKIDKYKEDEAGGKKSIFNYHISAFEIGEQKFSPLSFNLYDSDSGEMKTLRTEPIQVLVTSVITDTSSVIKDIQSVFKLSLTTTDYIIIILAILLLIAIIYTFVHFIVRKPRIDTSEEEEELIPAFIQALELLESLKEKKLLEEGNYLEYYFHLSYILRFFIEKQYHYNAVEMTTGEIREMMLKLREPDEEVLHYLSYTDMVKFAKHEPTINESLNRTEWLEKYLRSKQYHQSVLDTEEKIKNRQKGSDGEKS